MKRGVVLEIEQWHTLTGVLTALPGIHPDFVAARAELQDQVACMIQRPPRPDHVPGQLALEEAT